MNFRIQSQSKYMYRLILLLAFSCLYLTVYCQNNTCVDSIENYYYSWPNLKSKYNFSYVVDNNNNSILQTDTVSQSGRFDMEFIKFDNLNRFVYRKRYSQQNLPDIFKYDLAFTDNQNSIIFSGGVENNSKNIAVIAKLDSTGIMQWHKKYDQDGNTDGFYIRKSILGKNNSIIALSYSNINDKFYKLCVLDSTGNVLWAKRYNNLNGQIYPLSEASITFNGNEIILTGEFIYGVNNSQNGFFICRINYATGNIIESKSFNFLNNQSFSGPFLHEISDFNFDPISQTYMLLVWPDSRILIGSTCIVFDSNLDIIKARNFDYNGYYSIVKINASNTIIPSWPKPSDTSVLYAIINNKLDIISQKKIKLNSIAPIHNPYNYISKPILKNDNQFNLLTSSFGAVNGDDIILTGNSQDYNINNECFGYDTSFIISRDVALMPLNTVIDKETTLQITVTDLPLLIPAESPLQKIETCKEISICDSFKLSGQNKYCLDNPLARFTIYKNALCKRKTYWQTDSTAIQIIAKTDTSLDVKFLRPYRGYLYAGISGCVLKDSVWIEVYAPKTGVYLGKDTLYCPGKNIILDAGTGFKTYKWQDGSTSQTYNVFAPGQYSVAVTDSCNNLFTDTVFVKPMDIQLMADYPKTLCLYDTAVVSIPPSLYNISWQPYNDGLLIGNNQIKFFPLSTTLFTISADRFPGCTLTDTTLVDVKKCPVYIYFPTAFTPNNDGINDFYKPLFEGRLLLYEFIIYNRWGQVVFKTTVPNNCWDGVFKAGLPETGSYVYTCKYRFMNEQLKFKKGAFTLIK